MLSHRYTLSHVLSEEMKNTVLMKVPKATIIMRSRKRKAPGINTGTKVGQGRGGVHLALGAGAKQYG